MTTSRRRPDASGEMLRREAGSLGWAAQTPLELTNSASALVLEVRGAPTRLLDELALLVAVGSAADWWLDRLTAVRLAHEEAQVVATVRAGQRVAAARGTATAASRRRLDGARSGRSPSIPPDVVALMVKARLAGRGYRAIAAELDSLGIPTANGGRRWYPSTVRAALRREGGPD